MELLTWLPLIMRILNLIPLIQEDLRTGGSVISTIQKTVPDIMPILQDVGTKLFPTVDPDKAAQAGADVIFDVDGTKWVQNNLNSLNSDPATLLTVDGIYGAKTKAAVSAYQTAHPPLKVDGWSGPATSGQIAVDVAKHAVVTP